MNGIFSAKNHVDSLATDDARVVISLGDLIQLVKSARQLKINRNHILVINSGNYQAKFKGRGMEFDEARLYQPGDDVRQIDWRVTARTGKTHTKLFREERELPVFIAVDKRNAMNFATRGVFKSVLAANLAGLLAWDAQINGDKIGGQVFSQTECYEIKPQSGRRAVLKFFNLLLLQPANRDKPEISLDEVFKRLLQHTRHGNQVYIISDFRGFNQATELHLSKLAKNCNVTLIHIYDGLETKLPSAGRYRLVNGQQSIVIDGSNKNLLANYRQKYQTRINNLQKIAKKLRIKLLQISTTDNPLECLR